MDSIEGRITEAESKAEEARLKFEAAGGSSSELAVGGEGGDAPGAGGGEGWASYLDEESGRYYWFNEHTGEAYYDEGGDAAAAV